MFESLGGRLEDALSKIRGKARLSEADVELALREIRNALLEADVNLLVVRAITDRIREAAVGAMASRSLTPGQQVVKAVNDELINVLGGETFRITYESKPPTVILMAGLQGSGKTTTSAKLARYFKAQGRSPMLVGADLQRPAAVEQLKTLASQIQVPMFSEWTSPIEVAKAGVAEARRIGRDVVIIDTAGRLTVDAELMDEIAAISREVRPKYTFLVIDAMMGQDSVNTAKAFNDVLELDAIVLSKLDGDARGGAALSVKEVVGKPIAFASDGEKLDNFGPFHPDRMASRILGMGDVLTLIEQAERTMDEEVAERGAKKLMEGKFDLEDFLQQLRQVKKMGSLKGMLSMLPGVPKELRDVEIDDAELGKIEAMISSMTKKERSDPSIIDASRRARIAAGSGTTSANVSALIKQFKEMQKMMRSMGIGPASATKRRPKPRPSKKGRKNRR
ncbi:signal recognition particle subunit FFH/SRP54 (srp54) [Ferrithrix thermotolerans DSM 19514]|uniref:Signal recognition particle protein n=1 Tax=Ferrithrix thermotolerans DSM 19514 TaxID=1121881 RepID=A0A1M4VYY3_9ACTN|nr:signal recognition particle protein [Ferrithrix thermotolerans]SHE74159.1 signal recognition particle subunit FFH/SRP54 (srp54) [Ferrithrix thermotolerans DSM 19514]